MSRSTILQTVCGLSLTLPVSAGSWVASEFGRLDLDRSGSLSAAEAAPHAADLAGADADRDGALTLPEVENHVRLLAGRRLRDLVPAGTLDGHFKKLDQDGDGRLAGPELAPAEWLRILDANGDTAVTLSEITAVHDATAAAGTETIAPLEAPPPPYLDTSTSGPAVREEPRRLKPSELGVGRRLDDFEIEVLGRGRALLSSLAGPRGTVICVLSPTCPVAARQMPELARLSAAASAQGIGFAYLEAEDPLTSEQVQAFRLAGSGFRDPARRVREVLNVTTTTEVFVLDQARTLVYRGAIDDRHGVGWSRETARERYLADALDALVTGVTVKIAATTAPGCALDPVKSGEATAPASTFHNRISRILQTHCQQCHHQGGLGPFPLESLADVSRKTGMIRRMVSDDLMPPWFAAPPAAGHPTPWANDRALPAEDKADLLAWLETGRPEGDAADAPQPRHWPAEWTIGTPDAIFQIPQPIEVKAEGTMAYQNVLVETKLSEDRWVHAWEVLPTALPVVHHVLIWARDPSAPAPKNREDDDAGFFAAYVPGNNSAVYAPGLAKKLPAGTVLRFQIHFTPNGTPMTDQVRVGLRFAAEPPRHAVEVATIAQPRLRIPAGAAAHPEAASVPVPADVRLLGLFPHMHVRGKAFRFEVVAPDGTARTLLNVPRYDFNWQLGYQFAEPPTIAAGHRLRAIGWFDNSDGNPHNPDSSRTVAWGPQTTDEMMIGYVEYYVPSQPVPRVSSR